MQLISNFTMSDDVTKRVRYHQNVANSARLPVVNAPFDAGRSFPLWRWRFRVLAVRLRRRAQRAAQPTLHTARRFFGAVLIVVAHADYVA